MASTRDRCIIAFAVHEGYDADDWASAADEWRRWYGGEVDAIAEVLVGGFGDDGEPNLERLGPDFRYYLLPVSDG